MLLEEIILIVTEEVRNWSEEDKKALRDELFRELYRVDVNVIH